MKFFIPLLVTKNSVIKRKGAINKTSSPHLLQARPVVLRGAPTVKIEITNNKFYHFIMSEVHSA